MSNRIVTKENYKIGDKVVRGRDWRYGDQDKESIYGIIYDNDYGNWVKVKWINHKGMIVYKDSYRVGPEKFDLYFYE